MRVDTLSALLIYKLCIIRGKTLATDEIDAVTTPSTETATPPMSVSANAAKRISALIEQQGNPNLKLRLGVTGGGCSGFQYTFGFEEATEDGDIIIEKDGVKVLIDDMSLMYVLGSELDFVEDLVGASFQVKNPNAQSSCGCGTSFSV